ncbi:beta-hexosaminidase [Streptococcus pantholopis]|uniref:beta-N-acetylhexosaminidase n=1 Tax=Streptococcus pantholopis TaxID=1811193 RepID=A0A172QAK1_9STRE|nr:beta-hexosaminidase [Streptococcus pantholopis]
MGLRFYQTPAGTSRPPVQPDVESAKTKTIAAYLAEMSVEEKVGQLFFARVPEESALDDIRTYHLGAYLLFSRDFEGRRLNDIRALTASYQEVSAIPMIIASDEEGGLVTRISPILSKDFESPMVLYQTGGLPAVVDDAAAKAQLLKSVGITAGLFPVADVATEKKAFIYERTLGQDAQTTANYVAGVVETLKKEQFASTLKHFPGYGNNADTHTDLVYDQRSLEELESADFLPFAAGIKQGADSILLSHHIVTSIDDVPASLSEKMYTILRKDLNFDGVTITDDMDMAALNKFTSQEEAAYQVVQAGGDMIMSSKYPSQITYLLEKVKAGDLSEDRLDESVSRILAWKYDLGLLKKRGK